MIIHIQHFNLLEKYPDIGLPHAELPELKELIIDFGASGYVALYRYNKVTNAVYVLVANTLVVKAAARIAIKYFGLVLASPKQSWLVFFINRLLVFISSSS